MARSHNLSIIEAVETLSNIADLDLNRDIGIAEKHELILDNEKINYKTVHWLHKQDADATINLIKGTFRVILHYLKHFYILDYKTIQDTQTLENIKAIMVLVGEAAKKLDKYTELFRQTHDKSVTEFKEYRQLQEFYLSKIARRIDEGTLSQWILGLELNKKSPSTRQLKREVIPSTKRIFVDLESVKRDIEYELFFIRKEDGSRFFSPRLLRNMKLVCDFGNYFGLNQATDPLANFKQWFDRISYLSARNILKTMGFRLGHFFKELRKVKNQEVIDLLDKGLLALMLSSHANNLSHHKPIKSCAEYFTDFQLFLRKALKTRTYEKWIAYPPKETNHLALDLLDTIHTLCRALYTNLHGLDEMSSIVHLIIDEAKQHISKEHQQEAELSKQLWNHLASDHAAMVKLIKRHPNGPLLKVLEFLEEKTFHVFDPLMQTNLPNQLFDLHFSQSRIPHLRFPAPLSQEFIQKAFINEEFRGFLRDYKAQGKKHLLINLEDRTSWREHARCKAIEEVSADTELKEAICVVTLATNTDFYHQLDPYHQSNQASTFIEQLKEHVKGEGFGFYFPSSLNRKELFTFIDASIEAIHKTFFFDKNTLSRDRRLDFIEIFYVFLQLKLIELVNPSSFSLTNKDSIDLGSAYSAELFAFLKLINNQPWDEEDIKHLNFILYAPALLIRGRLMLIERFNRFLSLLRNVEQIQQEVGKEELKNRVEKAFSPLFKTSLLTANVEKPK